MNNSMLLFLIDTAIERGRRGRERYRDGLLPEAEFEMRELCQVLLLRLGMSTVDRVLAQVVDRVEACADRAEPCAPDRAPDCAPRR